MNGPDPLSSLTMFCQPGSHVAAVPTGTVADGAALPEGWQMIRARFNRDTGRWHADPGSPASIPVCPDHRRILEGN